MKHGAKPERIEWTAEADAELTRLWATGLSTSKIGTALGRAKNAVVGRARRMKLPPRGSPLANGPTCGNRKGDEKRARPAVPRPGYRRASPTHPAPAVASTRAAALLPHVPAPPRMPIQAAPRSCQWPEGERPRYLFCGDPTVPGRPYCEAHCRVAYITVRPLTGERREWAPW